MAKNKNYSLDISTLVGQDPSNCIIDFEVRLGPSNKYWGHATTPNYIKERLEYYVKSKENKSGLYFEASGLLILNKVTQKNIIDAVEDLIDKNKLETILIKIN